MRKQKTIITHIERKGTINFNWLLQSLFNNKMGVKVGRKWGSKYWRHLCNVILTHSNGSKPV